MVDQDNREGLVSGDEWYWYDRSKLPFWLRYDTWPVELGLCLICDINPEGSEDLNFDDIVDFVNVMPSDKPSHRLFESISLLSENPIYRLKPTKHPGKSSFSDAKQHLKQVTELWSTADDIKIKPEYIKPDFSDICDRIRLRDAANKKHMDCWALFRSNPEHLEQETFAPSYFIEWAASKNFSVPWFSWAEHNGYLVKGSIPETVADDDTVEPAKPTDKRLVEGMRAAKAILGQEHARGKLRNWQSFEKCMKKDVVIKYIRENPKDFPNCSKIEPILGDKQRQTIKDKEPTLTRDFPDFTKATELLREYERLTNEE